VRRVVSTAVVFVIKFVVELFIIVVSEKMTCNHVVDKKRTRMPKNFKIKPLRNKSLMVT